MPESKSKTAAADSAETVHIKNADGSISEVPAGEAPEGATVIDTASAPPSERKTAHIRMPDGSIQEVVAGGVPKGATVISTKIPDTTERETVHAFMLSGRVVEMTRAELKALEKKPAITREEFETSKTADIHPKERAAIAARADATLA